MSIDAIAQRTGYASNASLSKAFRREFGASPGAYHTAVAEVTVDGAVPSLNGADGPSE
jgi:transcriptional regulator GlxA family with amidase domain